MIWRRKVSGILSNGRNGPRANLRDNDQRGDDEHLEHYFFRDVREAKSWAPDLNEHGGMLRSGAAVLSGEAPDRSPSSTILAVACLFGAMVSFQIGASIAKSLFPLVGAEGATLLRQAIGAPLLIFLFRPWRSRPTRNSALPLISYGVALGAMSLLFYMSLRTIPLGIAVALYFSGPLTISAASLRRPPDLRTAEQYSTTVAAG